MTDYLTTSQAAQILNVSPQTVRRWEEEGKLTSSRTEGNHRRYVKDEVLALSQDPQSLTAKHISPPAETTAKTEFAYQEGLEFLQATSYQRWEQCMDQALQATEKSVAAASKATIEVRASPRYDLGRALLERVVPIALLCMGVCLIVGFALGLNDTIAFRILIGTGASLLIVAFALAGPLVAFGAGKYTVVEEENDSVEDMIQIAVPGRCFGAVISQPHPNGKGSQAIVSVSKPKLVWGPADHPQDKGLLEFLCTVDLQEPDEDADTATISERFYALCEVVKQMQQRNDKQRTHVLQEHHLDEASFDQTLKALQDLASQARVSVDRTLNEYAEQILAT